MDRHFAVTALLTLIAGTHVHGGSGEHRGKQPLGKESATGPPAASGWRWSLSAGPAYRQFGDVRMQASTLSSPAMIAPLAYSLASGRAQGAGALPIGALDRYADRLYRNGFVFIDDATEASASFLPGTTAYWGYESDGQVQGGSMFYDAGEYATASSGSSVTRNGGDGSADLDGPGFALQLEATRPLCGGWSVGGIFSYLVGNVDASRTLSTLHGSLRLDERAFAVADRYDLFGVVPPAAPYAGTFNHPGTAPLIDNRPTERLLAESAASSQAVAFRNRITQSFDLTLHTFSVGPSVAWTSGRFTLSGSAGVAINIARWEVSSREDLFRGSGPDAAKVSSWSHRRDGTDVLPGFFLQGSASCRLSEHWSLAVFGRRDWCDSLSASAGPSGFSVDLDSTTAGGFITYHF
jgi:hypothetical protein